MKSPPFVQVLPTLLLLLLSSGGARADGGAIRLCETRGPFVVTIFTAFEPVQDGPVEVSVMVQSRDSNEAILDATVELVFTPPLAPKQKPAEATCGLSGMTGVGRGVTQIKARATRDQSTNKLLYAASIKFSAAGNWGLRTFIKSRNDAVCLACDIPVASPSARLSGLVPYLLVPPLIVSLFAINQSLRKRPIEKDRAGNGIHPDARLSGRA